MFHKASGIRGFFSSLFRTAECDICNSGKYGGGLFRSGEQIRNHLSQNIAHCQTCHILLEGLQLRYPDLSLIEDVTVQNWRLWNLDVRSRPDFEERLMFFNMSVDSREQPQNSTSSALPPLLPPIYNESGSIDALDLAKEWIEKCNKTHPQCLDHFHDSILPHRVIDVRTEPPKLYISQNCTGKYITLSHCWGGVRHYVTEKNTLEQRCQAIEISELPKSFQDAILVTRYLKISFLWIDSICIVQDDRDDWLRESEKMCEIYSKSYLTLAASLAPNSHSGFLSPRDEWLIGKPIPGRPDIKVRIRGHVQGNEEDNPLNTRAWTLQEMHLSGRLLAYSSEDMGWRCLTTSTCECGSSGLGYSGVDTSIRWKVGIKKDIPRMPSRDEIVSAPGTDEGPPESDSDKDPSEPDIDPYPTKYWKGVIEEYTARDITKHSDRLIALSGIADEYQSRFGYRYLAGIWENDLPYALSWYAYAGGALPDTYIAPSWSWASIVGPVEYPVFQYSDKFSPAEFSSQQCKVIESGTTAERRETGLITDGYLVVRGQAERAFLVIKDTDSNTKPYLSLKEGGDPFGRGGLYLDAPLEECTSVIGSSGLESTPLKTFRRSSTEPMENSLSTEGCSSGNVLLLMIGWHRGNKHSLRTLFLVLVPSTRVAGAFERIGLLRSRMARPYSSPWEVVKIV